MTAPLTLEEIEALEKLERTATIGPWRFRGDDDSYPHRHMAVGVPRVGMLDNVDSDPQFVAAARNALQALLSMARRLVELESAVDFLNERGVWQNTRTAAIIQTAYDYGWTPPKGESE